MSDTRSVEPMTGVDAVLTRIFPFLNGAEPRGGELGTDRNGHQYHWQPARGAEPGRWLPVISPGPQREAEAG
jgi:hypothetical protein